MNKYIKLIILILILSFFYNELNYFIINENIMESNTINLCQTWGHLGDHIFTCYYLYYIKDYIEKNNIFINYYCQPNCIDQTKDFISSKNIRILNYKQKGLNTSILNMCFDCSALKSWFKNILKKINNEKINKRQDYVQIYTNLFSEISEKTGIPISPPTFSYNNPKILERYETLPNNCKNLDILIINSVPLSLQFDYVKEDWDNMIRRLNKKYKIATTLKVDDVYCTIDDKLKIFDIGAASTHAKVIIAINTGPTASIFNLWTLNNCKKIYLFDNTTTFNYHKDKFNYMIIQHLDNILELDLNQLYNYIKL